LLSILLILASFYHPQNDKATVYFYRVEEVSASTWGKPKLRIDDTPSLLFPEREFIGVRFKPGKYILKLGQPQSAVALIFETGKTYYVQVSSTLHGHGQNGRLDEIILQTEAQAELHFQRMKHALEDKNIINKTLEVIKDNPHFAL
jgi:hypothetical protein